MSGLGLLCVHAHPDDETIATGGVLKDAAARGHRTAVVTCTGGERGEIHNMDPEAVRPRLAEVRERELAAALRVLDAGPPRLLGYADSGMMGTDGNDDPASFWQANVHEAVGRLVAQVRKLRPDVLVTYDAFGGYGHPDHIQAHRVAVLAAEASGAPALYPEAGRAWRVRKVYLQTIPRSLVRLVADELPRRGLPSPFGDEPSAALALGTEDDQVTCRVDVRAHLDAKREALAAHVSQLDPSSFFLNMPADLQEAAFGTESFLRLRSDVAVPRVEHDLFTGLG